MVGTGGIWKQRECYSFPGAFKTYANLWEGITRWFPSNNQWVGSGVGSLHRHLQLNRRLRERGMLILKYNIKSYIFYESWTFLNSRLPHYHRSLFLALTILHSFLKCFHLRGWCWIHIHKSWVTNSNVSYEQKLSLGQDIAMGQRKTGGNPREWWPLWW
jgi:hypothetical protein